MNDLRHNLARVEEFLQSVTQSALCHFLPNYSECARMQLLSGEALAQFWRAWCKAEKPHSESGLYFIFYSDFSGVQAPLYVGKGQIPQQLFKHLGLTQYINEIIAYHFGRLAVFPQYLSADEWKRLISLCEVLKVGLLLLPKELLKRTESEFTSSLCPIANKEVYKFLDESPVCEGADGKYSLKHLAQQWPDQLLSKRVKVGPLPDLAMLKRCHKERLKA